MGGNQYTDAIQKDLNLSFDQAEALKRGEQVEGAAPENLHPILQAVSENIALEIQKTFDFFQATSSEDRIDRIFLAGGTAKVHGLRDLLADRFEAGVEILNPFNERDLQPEGLRPRLHRRDRPLGRHRRGPRGAKGGRPMIRINLVAAERPTKTRRRPTAGPATPPGALQAYLLLGLFAGGALVLLRRRAGC